MIASKREGRLTDHWPDERTAAQTDSPSENQAKDWTARIENFLGSHPHATVAAALAVGVALGWMVKRK